MQLKGKKINFLGDSITQGVGTSAPEFRFVDIIAAEEGAICRNYGISGTRIARQLHADPPEYHDLHDYCSRVDKMDADADVIVVFGGTNDYGHGDAPIGEMSDREDCTFYGALHVLCTKLINRYPEADIVFLTPFHRSDEQGLTRPDGRTVPPLSHYVDIIREVCEYYAIPVLDLFAAGKIQPCVPILMEKYMPDGLHPSDAGNRLLAGKLVSFLKAL